MIGGDSGFSGEGRRIGRTEFVDDRGDRLHFGEEFQARLRLARFRRLGAEAVDEGLQMFALLFLLLGALDGEELRLAPLLFEGGVVALIERQLSPLEMQNMRGDVVEQIAVMTDDDHARRIARQVIDEPQRPFEIEIIGRLVEEQQVGLGEQHRRQGDAHAPAAGEFRQRPSLRRGVEAQPVQDGGGPGGRRMGVDVGEPRLNLGDVVRIMRGLGPSQQVGALKVRRQHEVDQRRRTARRLLLDATEPCAGGNGDRAAFRGDFAADQPEQRGLAGAVTADEARAGASREEHPGVVEQQPAAEPVDEIVDREHCCDALGPRPKGCKREAMRGDLAPPVGLVLRRPRLYTRPRAAAMRPRSRAHRLEA